MPKVVAIADIHLHFWKAFATGFGLSNSRFKQTLEVIADSLRTAKELGAPWICAGDWVHTIGWVHNPVLSQLIEVLQDSRGVPKYTVWGNHDARSRGDLIRTRETVVDALVKSVPDLYLLDGRVSVLEEGYTIYGAGYQPGCAIDLDGVEATVGVFHQMVNGCVLPSGTKLEVEYALDPKELMKHFRVSIVGDIHHLQRFVSLEDGDRYGNLVLVPGSPEHHKFGETGDHGWWVVDLDTRESVLQKSDSPYFITVDGVEEVKADGNFYRITGPCDVGDIPEGAVALAPPKTVVVDREVLGNVTSPKEVLAAWVKLTPPGTGTIGECARYISEGIALLEGEGPVSVASARLQTVSLSNFLCYEDAGFKIEDGVTLVVGQARDFNSNGAGKTTLFEAVFWALFGRTTKGVAAEDVVRRGTDKCNVHLEIEVDGRQLAVSRTRTKEGQTLSVVEDGGEIWGGSTAEVTKALGQRLGITPDLFQALAYFSQSRLVLFSQATDSERKGMLSDLCGLEVFQKASTTARTRLKAVLTEVEAVVRLLEVERGAQVQAAEHLKELREMQVVAEAEAIDSRKALDDLVVELEARAQSAREAALIARRTVEDSYQVNLAALNQHRDELINAAAAKVVGVAEGAKERYDKAVVALGPAVGAPEEPGEVLSALISDAQQRLRGVEEGLGAARTLVEVHCSAASAEEELRAKGLCPTCGQALSQELGQENIKLKLEAVAEARGTVASLEASLVAEEAEQMRLKTQFATLQRSIEYQRSFESLTKELVGVLAAHSAESANVELSVDSQLAKDRTVLEVSRGQANSRVEATLAEQQRRIVHDRTVLDGQRKELAEAVDVFTARVTHASTVLAEHTEKITQREAAIAGLRSESQVMDYWADGFSRTGIQSLLLEEIAANFNVVRSMVFPLLTNGVYDVQFSTTSTTREGEAREKTAFLVYYRGALVPYESLSGGQRRRVDLGVMLSLSLSVARSRNVPGVLGMLVLDEVFGFLDEDGVEALYSTLVEVQSIVPAIYAITHNPDLQSLFPKVVVVVQDEYGVSHLEG